MTAKTDLHANCRLGVFAAVGALALGVIGFNALSASVRAEPAERANASPEVLDGYVKLGFDRLASFTFTAPSPAAEANAASMQTTVDDQIPAHIRKYDGQKVIITGFMLPTKMAGSKVAEFMLVSSPSTCCYGEMPGVNEWVVVKMNPGASLPVQLDVPVSLRGVLSVRGTPEAGYLTSIYSLAGENQLSW